MDRCVYRLYCNLLWFELFVTSKFIKNPNNQIKSPGSLCLLYLVVYFSMASLLGLSSYDSDDSNNSASKSADTTNEEIPDYQKTLADIDPSLSVKSLISIEAAPLVLYSVSNIFLSSEITKLKGYRCLYQTLITKFKSRIFGRIVLLKVLKNVCVYLKYLNYV